jgi:D-alanyl-D-alanine carboxypeptidase (penicillin-binding protein 5/6)
MQWGFNAWQSKPLFKAGTAVGSAKVQLGSDDEVTLVAPRDLAVTIPAGVLSKVTSTKIRYQGPVKAPIAKGQHVADLVVTTTEGEQVTPLVAAEAVEEAGFFARAWIGLKQLLGMA